jgi:sugar phosphate isomerase/epimerase
MIRGAHFDDVGVCFDVGHAHMAGSVREAFEILRSHICSTHIHDNDKMKDSHLWPGQGTIDWKEAMELLRSAPQTPPSCWNSRKMKSETAGEVGGDIRETGKLGIRN